jgi:hypothetical protein
MEEVPVFRAAKRRKQLKVQAGIPLDKIPDSKSETEENVLEEEPVGVSSLVRIRKQFRKPAGGVSFSNARDASGVAQELSVSKPDVHVDQPVNISQRFTSSMGEVVNVNQHMFVEIFLHCLHLN